MFSSKVFLILSVLAAVSHGKVVKVKNQHSTALVVSVGGTDHTVEAKALLVLDLGDEWSGSLSAVPVGAEVVDGPRTKVDLTISAAGDRYAVSLVDGFNLGAKVVPNGSLLPCASSVCAANLRRSCPAPNQVTDSALTVVACTNSPLMSAICPQAVTDALTAVTNVQLCNSATSYMVFFM